MAPKGLAAAVIASAVAEQLPEIGPQLKELTFAVVLVSIVATSVLVPLVDLPGVRGVVGWWFGGYRPR
jgi:NhaP-type Na+/H+ or K+/H+ antiporter